MQEHPERLSAEERLNEIADIMANAIIRLKKKKLRKTGHLSLDSTAETSVYGHVTIGEKL